MMASLQPIKTVKLCPNAFQNFRDLLGRSFGIGWDIFRRPAVHVGPSLLRHRIYCGRPCLSIQTVARSADIKQAGGGYRLNPGIYLSGGKGETTASTDANGPDSLTVHII